MTVKVSARKTTPGAGAIFSICSAIMLIQNAGRILPGVNQRKFLSFLSPFAHHILILCWRLCQRHASTIISRFDQQRAENSLATDAIVRKSASR